MPDPDQSSESRRLRAQKALRELVVGNEAFANGDAVGQIGPNPILEQRSAPQNPKAVVIGCVDARVPPEIVLGQQAGDLLTVRTAGQSLSGVALGSLEFGTQVLGVPLVVVLGHTNCGAVLAALSGDGDATVSGNLEELIGEVAARLVNVMGKDPIKATGGNVAETVSALREVGTLVHKGEPAWVVGLVYDLDTAKLKVIDDAGLFGN